MTKRLNPLLAFQLNLFKDSNNFHAGGSKAVTKGL
jgi:hypothetical protein